MKVSVAAFKMTWEWKCIKLLSAWLAIDSSIFNVEWSFIHLCYKAYAAVGRYLASKVKRAEIKSFANSLIPLQTYLSKLNFPNLIELKISRFVPPLKGGLPESKIKAITPVDQMSHSLP